MVHLTVGAALQAEEPFDPPSDQCAVETALCSSNTVELFALSSRRSILHARQLNCTTFTEWEDLGGAFAGGPTAVKNARGQLEVFARCQLGVASGLDLVSSNPFSILPSM